MIAHQRLNVPPVGQYTSKVQKCIHSLAEESAAITFLPFSGSSQHTVRKATQSNEKYARRQRYTGRGHYMVRERKALNRLVRRWNCLFASHRRHGHHSPTANFNQFYNCSQSAFVDHCTHTNTQSTESREKKKWKIFQLSSNCFCSGDGLRDRKTKETRMHSAHEARA